MNPYAAHLGDRSAVEVIENTARRLYETSAALGTSGVEWRPAPNKWNAREILCHLADCEIVFAFRLRQALAEDHHVIQPFDQEQWAKTYDARESEAALATFEAVRAWNLALLRSVTPSQLARPVMHPERGEMTFDTIIETMAGHDLNHVKQLEKIAEGSRSLG
jgi:uncharacterized damage-inducible protein DinB